MGTIENLWGSEGILGFPINCNAVLAHLKQDLRDDWIFDSIQYKDLLSLTVNRDLRTVLCDIVLEGNGAYIGDKRVICDIPKKGLGIRYALETDFYDRFVYQAICSFLIPFYDPLLSHRVLSHRYNKVRTDEKYIFKNRIDLWKTFEGITFTTFKDNKALLATDLINYFENITIGKIREAFETLLPKISANGKEKLQIRNAISTLCSLLEKWSYSEKHGLPQNRDASSFIANIVLNSVDKKMESLGYDYYRYVDDIRIICDNQQDARRILNELITELRNVGMNINSGKTKILSSETSSQDLFDFFPNTDDRSNTIDNMWRSKSRRIITRSIPLICDILKECIEKKESQSRQFRFSVNRLSMLIEANIFDLKSEMATELLKIIVGTLAEQPASTDQYCRILSLMDLDPETLLAIEEYISNETIAIHPWQNYHLWYVLAKKKYKSEKILRTAKARVMGNLHSIENSAIFIYLYCVEGSESVKDFIPEFSQDWSYQQKRHFLFAAKDLSPEALKPILESMSSKTSYTLKRANPFFSSEGLPLAEKDQMNLMDLYNNITPYD